MADIFISYASEDRERAKTLAQELEAEGWSVWWDRLIPFGKPFDEVIQENLHAARCVIVLWTEHSVASKWVRSEAAAAEERHTLVPVMLDEEVQLPLAFKLLQCANLHDWEPGSDNAEYDKLLAQVRTLVDATGAVPQQPIQEPRRRLRVKRRSALVLVFLVLPSIVAVAGALVLMNWRVPTQIELDMRVDRVSFTLAGTERVAVFERAISFDALSLEQLAHVTLSAARLTPLDPPGPARTNVALTLEAAPQDRMALDFEGHGAQAGIGRMAALAADPGTQAVLEVRQGATPALILRLDGAAMETSVLPVGALDITVSNAAVVSPADLPQVPRWRARVELAEAEPIVSARATASAFTAIVTPARATQVLPGGGAGVSEIELLKQTANGGYASALVAPATLSYPGYDIQDVQLEAGSLLSIEGLHEAALAPIAVQPGQAYLAISLRATVDEIQSRVGGGQLRDHRLSLFDKLWHGSRTALLFTILVWVTTVTIGAYRLVKEAKG